MFITGEGNMQKTVMPTTYKKQLLWTTLFQCDALKSYLFSLDTGDYVINATKQAHRTSEHNNINVVYM